MVTKTNFGQIMDEADDPGFFKILRREDLSSEIMRGIPLNFIKNISDKEFLAKMVLKLPWGSSWPIKISRNSSFYYMEKNGWDQFLSDNGLGNNEFLTFTHKGKMSFCVNIYQRDGTELLRPLRSATTASFCRIKREQGKRIYKDVKKEETESSSDSSCSGSKTAESTVRRQRLSLGNKITEDTRQSKKKKNVCNDSEAETLSLVPEFTTTIKKAYLISLNIPKSFEVVHMPKKTTMFKIHDPEGKKTWEVTYKVIGRQSRLSAGWICIAKELGLVVGDVCTLKLIKPTEMVLKITK